MESSANDTFGNQDSGSASMGTVPATGAPDASFSRGTEAPAAVDRATSSASSAGDRLAEAGSAVRDKAGSLKATLADALESGAERLRQQGSGGAQLAGAAGADTIAEDSRLAQTSHQLAGGMQGAADWLRDADLDGLKSGIERQVKEHPGRSLAVAIGVGYLLGKAFRK